MILLLGLLAPAKLLFGLTAANAILTPLAARARMRKMEKVFGKSVPLAEVPLGKILLTKEEVEKLDASGASEILLSAQQRYRDIEVMS